MHRALPLIRSLVRLLLPVTGNGSAVSCAPAAAGTTGGTVSAAGAFSGLPVPDHTPDRKAYCQHQDRNNHKIDEIACKP